jgi:predicted MFS family arabinose efflux permease
MSAYITDVTRRARYEAAHGVFGTIYDIGDALGAIAAGLLIAAAGYVRMFQVMPAVAVVMAVGFAITSMRASARGTIRFHSHVGPAPAILWMPIG